jgi:hypothetical protein
VRYRILKHERPYAVLHDADHCPWLDSTTASPGHQQWAKNAYHVVDLTKEEAEARAWCSSCLRS